MVLFSDIVSSISRCTALYARLTQAQLLGYFDVARRFAPLISMPSRRPLDPIPALPDNVALVLSMHTKLSLDDVFEMWSALGHIILSAGPGELVTGISDVDTTLAGVAPHAHLGKSAQS